MVPHCYLAHQCLHDRHKYLVAHLSVQLQSSKNRGGTTYLDHEHTLHHTWKSRTVGSSGCSFSLCGICTPAHRRSAPAPLSTFISYMFLYLQTHSYSAPPQSTEWIRMLSAVHKRLESHYFPHVLTSTIYSDSSPAQ